jgi:parallel beta-helix repeat protein
MTVSTLTLRQTKGARLTTVEMDNNWLYCSDFVERNIRTIRYWSGKQLTSSTGNAGLVGVSINTNALGVNISKCTLLDNQQDGIQIQGGSYIQITDNDISSNNKGAGVSYSGIRFVANADHVDILRNRIKNHLSSNYTHAYGILTTGGGVISNLTVGENDIANYVTAAFTDNAGATSKNSRSWTPTVAGAAVTVNAATYSVAGELILVTLDLTWPATADATAVTIAGMAGIPGAPAANSGVFVSGYTTYTNDIHGVAGTAGIALYNKGGNPATALTNADLSGLRIIGSCVYHI